MILYLGLADYLIIAKAVLGVPAEVLCVTAQLNLADSALNAPAASFGGVEMYPDFAMKAAILCSRLGKNYALIDGNKRAAYCKQRRFFDPHQRHFLTHPVS